MSIPKTMKAIVVEGDQAVLKNNVPVPQIGPKDLLVKVKAAAGNPTDWKHITFKIGPQGSIVGCDASGEVVEVGAEVDSSKFKKGDTVTAVVHGCSVLHPDNGAFAEYCRASSFTSVKIDNLTSSTAGTIPAGQRITNFESAAALPVSLYTALLTLAHNFQTNIDFEKVPSTPQHNFPLLVWGGATGFGQYIIQVAKLVNAYSKIIVVASKKHGSLLRSFGADELFDYHDSDVLDQISKKYPDLVHLVDGVSNEETFKQTYQLASKNEQHKATVVNLMNFTEDLGILRGLSFTSVKIDNLTSSTAGTIPAGQRITNFESAAALPVSLYTALLTLAHNFQTNIDFEKVPSTPQHNFPLLVWGGATGFGQYIIQVAKLVNAYSKIIVVASKKHESLLRSFGADELFDYHDSDVLDQISEKYPDLVHLVDGVSNEETFKQTYQLASKNEQHKATVVNLMNFTEDKIPSNLRRNNVAIGLIFLYSISGEDIPFGPVIVPKDLDFAKLAAEVISKLQTPISQGKLKTIAIKNHKGLEAVPEILEGIKTGKNSGEKFVTTL
ncbi:hypothetical protein ACO0RG_000720 [Hanseniaspora osmophila]